MTASSGTPLASAVERGVTAGPDDAAALAVWSLGFPVQLSRTPDQTLELTPSVPTPAAIAEAIRATLWAYAGVQARGAVRPVHTSALLHALRPVARLLTAADLPGPAEEAATIPMVAAEDPSSDPIRLTLDDLAEVGDVATLGGGWWLPAPCRVVPLADGRTLLLGGPPIASWPAAWRHALELGPLVRALRWEAAGPPPTLTALPVESLAEWMRGASRSVVDETREVLEKTPLALADLGERRVEAYVPARGSIDMPQALRWYPVSRAVPDGRTLLRIDSRGGRSTAVGEVCEGRVTAVSVPLAPPVDTRRLQYGLDLLAGCSTRAELTVDAGGATATLVLRSTVPSGELRLLTALGRLLPNSTGRYYPRRWQVPAGAVATIRPALRGLGITLNSSLPARRQTLETRVP